MVIFHCYVSSPEGKQYSNQRLGPVLWCPISLSKNAKGSSPKGDADDAGSAALKSEAGCW